MRIPEPSEQARADLPVDPRDQLRQRQDGKDKARGQRKVRALPELGT